MRNYGLVFITFIFLFPLKIVIAKEYNLGTNIRQLLCNILNQEDIPAELEKLGKVSKKSLQKKEIQLIILIIFGVLTQNCIKYHIVNSIKRKRVKEKKEVIMESLFIHIIV